MNEYYVHDTKTKASIREISIDDNTLGYLNKWKEIQHKNIGACNFIFTKDVIPTNKSSRYKIIDRHSKLVYIHRLKDVIAFKESNVKSKRNSNQYLKNERKS